MDEGRNGGDQATEHDGLSRRRALGYGGAIVAGAAASQLVAGSASAAGGGSLPMRTISLSQANRIIGAALRYVRDNDLPPMYVLVVDACGDEKASRRMDGNSPAAVGLVPPKARTAISFRQPTINLSQITDPGRIASFTAAGFSLLGGGRPITEGEGEGQMVIGAIAVGGGSPEQDDQVAQAALEAL
jgi:glc operon protein GlcG